MKISNPVLTGFHADPSMIRVGDTYYIANSTFEWFPGVRLHESKDLVHWNILPSPLSRSSQLDMRGNPSSGGIWAPDLSYADGRFWLIYTDVKVVNGAFKDCTNYLPPPTVPMASVNGTRRVFQFGPSSPESNSSCSSRVVGAKVSMASFGAST